MFAKAKYLLIGQAAVLQRLVQQDLTTSAAPSLQAEVPSQSAADQGTPHSAAQELPGRPTQSSKAVLNTEANAAAAWEISPEALPPLASLFGPPQALSQDRGGGASSKSSSPQRPQPKAKATSSIKELSAKDSASNAASRSSPAHQQSEEPILDDLGTAYQSKQGDTRQDIPLTMDSTPADIPKSGNEQMADSSAPENLQPQPESSDEKSTKDEMRRADAAVETTTDQAKLDPRQAKASKNGNGNAADAVAEAIRAATAASGGAGRVEFRKKATKCKPYYMPERMP